MNYLVILDPDAGELEKILSGTKSMVVKEFNPAQSDTYCVSPGDGLYFMRSKDEAVLLVKAIVSHVVAFACNPGEDLSHTLKEMQPKLQLTEEQYNHWSVKKWMILVEFGCAQKISPIHIAEGKTSNRSNWIAFEEMCLIKE